MTDELPPDINDPTLNRLRRNITVERLAANARREEEAANAVVERMLANSVFKNGTHPAGTLPPVLTAHQFLELPDPPDSDNLLGPLLRRRQRTIVGGHTGEGKTTVVAGMLAAFLAERDFLGFHGAGGRALIIDLEQGQRSIKLMLRAAGLDVDSLGIWSIPDGLDLDKNEEQRIEVEAKIRDGHYDIVVLDPYYKGHTGDSSDERETDALMRIFDHWRTEYGFCFVMPAHCRKPNPAMPNAFTIHDIFGSSAFLRGAEVVLGIRRVKDGYSKLHFFKDRDGELLTGTAWGLLFSRQEGFRRDPKDGVERDYLGDLLVAMRPGTWYTVSALKAPKEKGGIGARKEAIETTLAANPDLFETGDKVAAGRSQDGIYWKVPDTRYDPSPEPRDGSAELKMPPDPSRAPVTGSQPTRHPSPPYIGDGWVGDGSPPEFESGRRKVCPDGLCCSLDASHAVGDITCCGHPEDS